MAHVYRQIVNVVLAHSSPSTDKAMAAGGQLTFQFPSLPSLFVSLLLFPLPSLLFLFDTGVTSVNMAGLAFAH